MQIRVDRDRCIGSGNCSFYAEATFGLDDELKVVVLDGAADGSLDAPADIRAAAEGCPVKAIIVTDRQQGDEPDQEL